MHPHRILLILVGWSFREPQSEQLKMLIAELRRMQFGRKSEKLDWQTGQLELKTRGEPGAADHRFPCLAGRINKFPISRLLPCNLSPILSEERVLPPWPVSVGDRQRSESAVF